MKTNDSDEESRSDSTTPVVGNAIVEMILSSADNGNASISVSFVSGISSDMVNAMKARPVL